MKATINPELCIGCGLCAETCPEVYKMENDKAISIVQVIPPEAEARAKQGAVECPVEAIVIES